MKLKQALFSLFTITLLAFGGWLTILFNVNPLNADRFMHIALYASLFLFILGIATFIGYGVRVLLSNREVVYAHFPASLRQGTLLAFVLVGLLFLQSLRVLSVIDAAAFILAVFLIELFFRAKPARRPSYDSEDQE